MISKRAVEIEIKVKKKREMKNKIGIMRVDPKLIEDKKINDTLFLKTEICI